MSTYSVDASLFKKMFLAGAMYLESQKEVINELNVFPVPDGDTGTNMTLTIISAVNEVNAIEDPDMSQLTKAISSGSLKGARGNSGVILSQLFRGFYKGLKGYDTITAESLKSGLNKAVETAYKAVMVPKEGTILTVAKAASDKINEIGDETRDLEVIGAQIVMAMKDALDNTPELLPVLKEAGVVDSGGAGLLDVIYGMRDAFNNPDIEIKFEFEHNEEEEDESDNVYCTSFSLHHSHEFLTPQKLDFRNYLEALGDEVVFSEETDVLKVHMHTVSPGLAIEKAVSLGVLTDVSVINLKKEHKECSVKTPAKEAAAAAPAKEEPRKENGFVAVSVGEGMNEIFRGFGVDYIIEGGQTMNPSTEDMLNAIAAINADNIFILPNNSNIILAASQARDLTKDKNVIVINSKTIPQGISAMISFMEGSSPEDNEAAMTEGLGMVKTGQITYAVRDTSIDGHEIHVNDIMGLGEGKIIAVGTEIEDTAFETIISLAKEDEAELITLYYGEGINESDAAALAERVGAELPDTDVEVHNGGQPVYYYVVSVE